MLVIRLFCNQGMSTSLLVSKMNEAAEKQGLEVDIAAYPANEMDSRIDGVDCALLGPQVGYLINDKADSNFDYKDRNTADRLGAQKDAAQDTLDIKHKFDYGIAAGAGMEFSHPKVGHFILEGRYYYGLGDIYGNSKRDYFGRSNNNSIIVKLTYLFDISRTKNSKIK